ncbi:MAG: hydantoinase/oxoprolinase family protein [Candidatus Heimdallarchaeota archaeon]
MRVAIDIGGTFTDILLYEEPHGVLWSAKVPSNLKCPEQPFIDGLKRTLRAARVDLQQVSLLIHGTTIVTNALLEGKTARVGLLLTQGFRDLLEIGRQQRPSLYNLMEDRRPPLVPRSRIKEIQERISADGHILIPLDEEDALTHIKALMETNIESLAIMLLFSFLNQRHEESLRQMARQFMDSRFIFLSSQISPEFREFERGSTTVIAAAVAPIVVSYLQAIDRNLRDLGWDNRNLAIMHSGGGTLRSSEAVEQPHSLTESGPAAGIIGAGHLARALKINQVIAFDMGGTTAKAGLILDGKPQYTTEYEVGGELHHGSRIRGSGYPIRTPMIDVVECGAGAGSIAWIDSGGHLKVGPRSAGADPGPACYGKGGNAPTVTDAHLILNRLSPDSFLSGEMILKPALASEAINSLSGPLELTLEEAAQGIVDIANASMIRLLRLVSVARGHDPRSFTLVAYGGAGPLHATELAEEMSISRVIIPPLPGLFSALGLLYADMCTDFVETSMMPLDARDSLNEILARLRDNANEWFQRNNVPPKTREIRVSADARYFRQNYELNLSLPGSKLSLEDIELIRLCFHKAHAAEYGHCALDQPIQVVNVRMRAVNLLSKPELSKLRVARSSSNEPLQGSRSVWFHGKMLPCEVYERSVLPVGYSVDGPAIIQEKEATTFLGEEWHLQVDVLGNLVMER